MSNLYFTSTLNCFVGIILDINKLYDTARSGGELEENKLFSHLSEIFYLFVRLRVGDKNDCQDIVQNTLMDIANNYRDMKFNVGFSAWAHSILKHKLVDYYRMKRTKESKFVRADCIGSQVDEIKLDTELERSIQKCLRKIIL